MANDRVSLANLGLQMIGAKRIVAFDEASAEARAVSAVYDDLRDAVLCETPWSFAQKRVAFTILDITPVFTDDRMTIVYARPSDLLKLNFLSDASAIVKVEHDGIYSDTRNLKAIYTFRNDDPTTYFSAFTLALATRIAAELCFSLTESSAKAERLYELYESVRLPRAVAEDSQQGTPLQMLQDEWTFARVYGNANLAPQTPGAQTWHPLW